MQTTLRIDDALYREAKAEAARSGVTLTRFLEEGLRMRLQQQKGSPAPHVFRIHQSGTADPRAWEEITHTAMDEEEQDALDQLGLNITQS